MSLQYYKDNRKDFINTVFENHEPSDNPVAIFMAGTPGSGKTEVAESLCEIMTKEKPVILDADKYRELFRSVGYNGKNSSKYQEASNKAVEEGFDHAVKKGYSFILDGTFSIGKATVNIKRTIRHKYNTTQIYFIYQEPIIAWDFTKKRELKEGRAVPKETFIKSYFKSRENIKLVKEEFGDQVTVDVMIKNYKNETIETFQNVSDVDTVIGKLYTEDELKAVLI